MAVMCRAAARRCETKPSMLRRCNGWDYRRPCIYQMTIVLADRRSNALGRLVIDNDGGLGLPPQAHDVGATAGGATANGVARAASSVPAAEAVGDPAAVRAHVELTSAGEAVVGEWRRIAEHHPEVKPLAIQGLAARQRRQARRRSVSIGLASHQPPTTNHQPPATNHQPPATSHQPPTTSHQPLYQPFVP